MMPSIAAGKLRAVAEGNPAQLARIHDLEAQVAELETALGMNAAAYYPRRLAPQQRAMFGMLLTRGCVSRVQFQLALYAAKPESDRPGDPDTVLKVQMHYLRRRLAPDGIEIETILSGDGCDPLYRLAPGGLAKAMALMSPVDMGEVAA